MTDYLAIDRMSVGSFDDDQFYSAPSSRVASRHVSLRTSPRNLQEEANYSAMPVGPFASTYPPSQTAPGSPTEPQNSASKRVSKSRWALPFTTRHRHNPKHRHLFPKPIGHRFYRPFHRTSEATSLLQPLTDESEPDPGDYMEPLHLSLVSPAMTGPWSSTYVGDQSPRSKRSHSVVDRLHDAPITISRQGIDAIVCNIQAYLSDRRHNNCSSRSSMPAVVNENRPPSSYLQTDRIAFQNGHVRANRMAADSYLVTTDDIAGILDIVIAGIRRTHDDIPTASCLSIMLPKEELAKPTPAARAIIPGLPNIADPATTISSIQPSFSLTGCSGRHKHYVDANRTTFISRQSITEVA
ncbi:hypothetical protein AAE478_008085 [Parahypoxylon ruwenzoriense]